MELSFHLAPAVWVRVNHLSDDYFAGLWQEYLEEVHWGPQQPVCFLPWETFSGNHCEDQKVLAAMPELAVLQEVRQMSRVRYKSLEVEMMIEFEKSEVNFLFVHQEDSPPTDA